MSYPIEIYDAWKKYLDDAIVISFICKTPDMARFDQDLVVLFKQIRLIEILKIKNVFK